MTDKRKTEGADRAGEAERRELQDQPLGGPRPAGAQAGAARVA